MIARSIASCVSFRIPRNRIIAVFLYFSVYFIRRLRRIITQTKKCLCVVIIIRKRKKSYIYSIYKRPSIAITIIYKSCSKSRRVKIITVFITSYLKINGNSTERLIVQYVSIFGFNSRRNRQ